MASTCCTSDVWPTSPGRGQHPPCFHNGTAATLEEVVHTYNRKKALYLTDAEIADLVQCLKSL